VAWWWSTWSTAATTISFCANHCQLITASPPPLLSFVPCRQLEKTGGWTQQQTRGSSKTRALAVEEQLLRRPDYPPLFYPQIMNVSTSTSKGLKSLTLVKEHRGWKEGSNAAPSRKLTKWEASRRSHQGYTDWQRRSEALFGPRPGTAPTAALSDAPRS